MLGNQQGADQLVVDKRVHDIDIGALNRIARRWGSGGRDKMVERADLGEQAGDVRLVRHVASDRADLSVFTKHAHCRIELLLRPADKSQHAVFQRRRSAA